MKTIIVVANIENLQEVIGFVNAELERHSCPKELRDKIDLAVEEIFVNIANYAYTPASGSVDISIVANKDVVIRFEDTGKPYYPLEHPPPDLDKPLAEREIGGLGIFIVKQTMDKIDYERVDNKNVFTMTKKLSSPRC